jgi:hypothetical protein
MTDDELERVGREIHGMFHAGATETEAFARLKGRLTKNARRIDDMPWLIRLWCTWGARILFRGMWSTAPCHPATRGRLVICDASRQIQP